MTVQDEESHTTRKVAVPETPKKTQSWMTYCRVTKGLMVVTWHRMSSSVWEWAGPETAGESDGGKSHQRAVQL